MLTELLQLLPKVAGHPLAIVAYICLAGGWILGIYWDYRSKDFHKAIESIPKQERLEFARRAGYKYNDLVSLPPKQRLKALTNRYRLFALIATLVAILLFGFAYLRVYFTVQQDVQSKYEQVLRIKEIADAALARYRIQIEGIRGSANTAGRLTANLELQRVGKELDEACDIIDKEYPTQQTVEMATQIRLARATAAVAKGAYREALDLISNADLEGQQANLLKMLLVRADASFGLGEWIAAKDYYERVLRIAPSNIGAYFGAGNSAFELRKLSEAISIWNKLYSLVDKSNLAYARITKADALSNRANAHALLGDFIVAINEYTEVLGILNQLRTEGERDVRTRSVLAFSSRGGSYGRLGNLSNALEDCNHAVVICDQAMAEERPEFAIALSEALVNRGLALIDLRRYPEAVADESRAISILERNGRNSLSNYLASAFNNRGNAYYCLGQPTNAITDETLAIQIREALAGEGHPELSNDLATAIDNRGNSYQLAGQFAESLADHIKAISIWENLVNGDHPELDYDLSLALCNRAQTYKSLGQLTNAVSDQLRAIQMLQELIEKKPMKNLRPLLAKWCGHLAQWLHEIGRIEESNQYMDKAFLLRSVVPVNNPGLVISNNFVFP